MTEYTTRNLTADEQKKLMSGLILATGGKIELINSVLRVIADQGLGVFVATACHDCGGDGRSGQCGTALGRIPCTTCNGTGSK